MAAFSLFWLADGFITTFVPVSPRLTLLPRRRRFMGQFIRLHEARVLVSDHLLLPELRHQESARVVLGPAVLRKPYVVAADDLIRGLLLVLQPVDFLYTECRVGEWRTHHGADAADREVRNDV